MKSAASVAAIGLDAAQVDGFLPELGQECIELLADLGRQLLLDVEDLLTQLALRASELILDQAGPLLEFGRRLLQLARQILGRRRPRLVLALDSLGEGLGFGAGVLLDGRQPLADILAECRRFRA